MPPQQVLRYIDQHTDQAIERLLELLAIPSISTDPAYTGEIEAAASWIQHHLTDTGLAAQIMPTGGHPCVVGRTPRGMAPEGAPTVLFYGHYDVQPPDPLDLWTSGPFEPEIRHGAVFARGSSDDKGQVMCFLEALRAWVRAADALPVNVIVLIEGEEECSSVNLGRFLEAHRGQLGADVALVSDTAMWDRKTLAITYALRGIAYFDIQLHGPLRDLHSGVYGGAVPNPANLLARVLAGLFDDRNRVTIPGFYDDVVPLSNEERRQWAALAFDEQAFLGNVGVSEDYGEAGYELLERRWARPSCDINGLYGGYSGEGAKTIIPRYAGAKLSFRLAPHQDPARIAQLFENWLHRQPVAGYRWQVTRHGWAAPVMVPTDSPHMSAAQRAAQTTTGRPPVLIREGATIPVVADFKRVLDVDSILLGFGQNDDCIHAPNEKFELSCYDLGIRTHATLLAELGRG